ncbi:type II toxin-antitoxin system RelE/ParE family toxin [Candidatus Pacearchaeota archaeon]|nr:type II toxin-antitoxin system RelE/ParE family toxin [Candidatus Pacearchaeota archaeon]
MVKIIPSNEFIKQIKKLDSFNQLKLEKQIRKIVENPNVGKPLKYKRNERTLYIKPFRLIYSIGNNEIILLKFEHRKSIYS